MNRPIAVIPASLIAAICGLTLLLALQIILPLPRLPGPPAPTTSEVPEMAALTVYVAPARESYTELLERPPFSPNRRPESIAETPSEEVTVTPPDIRLLGIISSGNSVTAVVKPSGDGDLLNVGPGDMVGGWLVVHVDRRRIVLEAGDKEVEMWLDGEVRRDSTGIGLVLEKPIPTEDGPTE